MDTNGHEFLTRTPKWKLRIDKTQTEKIRASSRRLLQFLETFLELREREKFTFARFNLCEALLQDLFVPARRFQFLRLGGHQTPKHLHRL